MSPDEILAVPRSKNFLDAMENDTKSNFQEDFPPICWGPCYCTRFKFIQDETLFDLWYNFIKNQVFETINS